MMTIDDDCDGLKAFGWRLTLAAERKMNKFAFLGNCKNEVRCSARGGLRDCIGNLVWFSIELKIHLTKSPPPCRGHAKPNRE